MLLLGHLTNSARIHLLADLLRALILVASPVALLGKVLRVLTFFRTLH